MLTGGSKDYAVIEHYVSYGYQITAAYDCPLVLSSVVVLEAVHEPRDECSNQCAGNSSDVIGIGEQRILHKRSYQIGNECNHREFNECEGNQPPKAHKVSTSPNRAPSFTHYDKTANHCAEHSHVIFG